ncbi:MAG: YfhO family protein [bacterium]|nr:YfhO family protein [bacterium]
MPDSGAVYNNDKAEIIEYKPDYIEIKTDSIENGILFLSEIYYPGWEAYVDGVKTEIYQADYMFRSIKLPSGNHTIKFTYNPKIFKTGAAISIISLFSTIISLLYLSLLERKKSKVKITYES